MPYFEFTWTEAIRSHVAEHGITAEDFEWVVSNAELRGRSRSIGRPCCWGETLDGRYLLCVYEYIDALMILPITAYEVRRPRRQSP
jgi:hypothetical protein